MNQMERFQQLGTILTHYENPKTPAPKKFVRHPPKTNNNKQWLKCEMKITRVGGDRLRAAYVDAETNDAVDPDSTLAHRLWGQSNLPEGVKYVMDLEVELVTAGRSRPHQLRGQLAQLGCPIVGDEVYGGGVCETGAHRHVWNRMAVQCCELSFPEPKWKEEDDDNKAKKTLVASDRIANFRLHTAWWTGYLEDYNMNV